ncbi:MAG TPA: rhomboid family intramembrane serine protease [Candidatus Thermoplasmatota archaeon]|nr:rhomboid family intramembrane serine protease [Candidatus Thermoplasmatota archaeon]
MALLPEGPFALAGLAVAAVGTALLAWRRDLPKAYGLAVLCFLVFLVQYAGAVFSRDDVIGELGFQPARFLDGGSWWSPFTANFLHGDLTHIAGNVFILATAGPALEDRVGPRRFLVVYFLAGFAAMGAHLAMALAIPDAVSPLQFAIGASGAIFGILTTFAVRYPFSPLPVLLIFTIAWFPAFAVLLLYLGFNVAYMLATYVGGAVSIAWWGHFAGFLVGLPFAYLLPPVAVGEGALPDPEKLAPLATTPRQRQLLDKIRQFSPEHRTANDSTFALAWVDQFLTQARCPACGEPFERSGLTATCKRGETTIDFARA